MENILTSFRLNSKTKTLAIDFFALLAIYFVPVLSHLTALPIYFIEPMRIMLILALAHTTKRNSYLIALTLPVFSFLVSAHPSLVKSLLMSFELGLNIWLFYFIAKRVSNNFVSMFASIAASKIFFYGVKFTLVGLALWSSSLVTIPILMQLVMTIILSVYIYFALRKN